MPWLLKKVGPRKRYAVDSEAEFSSRISQTLLVVLNIESMRATE